MLSHILPVSQARRLPLLLASLILLVWSSILDFPKPLTAADGKPVVAPAAQVRALEASLDQGKIGESRTFDMGGKLEIVVKFVPGGEFLMGSPKNEAGRDDDEDQVKVVLTNHYWIGETEVTQGQWNRLMKDNPSNFRGHDLPVERVKWKDAQEFIAKLNATVNPGKGWVWKMPSEAQWERACRAGSQAAYFFGKDSQQLQRYGNAADKNFTAFDWGDKNQDDGYGNTTAPVKAHAANAYGLYGLLGNVWEWCDDWYEEKLPGGTDPRGTETDSSPVCRGGSWHDRADRCRSACRETHSPFYFSFNVGFRLALVRE